MSEIINFQETRETKCSSLEKNQARWTIELGNLAIERSEITINDPVVHLCDYIRRGDKSIAGIKEDFETTISERFLDKNAYIFNKIKFTFEQNDFVSNKDKVSMKSMTKNSIETMKRTLSGKPNYFIEIARAKAEITEIDKIIGWFNDAPTGTNLVFESLPISDNEEYAFVRIYNKLNNSEIEGGFFSLHNSSIEQFNDVRKEFKVFSDNQNEIEMLCNCYQINNPKLNNIDETVKAYTGIYDKLLSEKNNKKYSFGIENNSNNTFNGLAKIRQLPSQTDIYIDTLKAIKNSNGLVSDELFKINKDFKTKKQLRLGQQLTASAIREQLESVIVSIASTVDKADKNMMIELSKNINNKQANRDIASHFGNIARDNGEEYKSNGCPEFRTENTDDSLSEISENDILAGAFGSLNKLKNFGKESVDICRISNCPSRGEIKWLPQKTKVGGCKVCVGCHILFQKGKNPEQVYKYKQNIINLNKTNLENKQKTNTKEIEILSKRQLNYKKRILGGDNSILSKYKKVTRKINRLSTPAA